MCEMKNIKFYLTAVLALLWFPGCYTIVDMGQPLSDSQIEEIESDYQEEDEVYSFYSERFYGGYSGYHALPWWYDVTPVTVSAGGSGSGNDNDQMVTRKREKDIQNLRNRDGGRGSYDSSTGSASTRGSSGGSSGSSATSTPATKSASNDSGSRSSGSEDNKSNSGRGSTGGGRK